MNEPGGTDYRIHLAKLETELRIISDKIISIDSAVKQIDKEQNELKPIIKKADDLYSSIEKVEKKTPPIATTIAAFGILAAAIGGSLFNTFSLGGTVDDLKRNMASINQEVSSIPAKIQNLVDQTNENVSTMATKMDAASGKIDAFQSSMSTFNESLSDTVGSLSDKLNQQIQRLSELDRRAAELLARLQSPLPPLTSAPSASSSTRPFDPNALILALGNQAPPHFRKLFQANSLLSEGAYDDARRLLFEARDLDTEDDTGIYSAKIAESYLAQDNFDLAEQYFKEAISIDERETSYYNNLGSTYFSASLSADDENRKKELLTLSVEILEKGIEISNEGDPEADQTLIANLATSLTARGKFTPKDFDTAITLLKSRGDQENPDILYQLARTYAGKGERTNALAYLGRSVEKEPLNAIFAAADPAFEAFRNDASFRKFAPRLE